MRATQIRLHDDRRGVTALEYGLLAGLIAVALIASLTAINGSLTTMFNTVSSNL